MMEEHIKVRRKFAEKRAGTGKSTFASAFLTMYVPFRRYRAPRKVDKPKVRSVVY